MLILERYIIRNHIGPFFFSLSILTFIFVIDFVLRYIDPFLKKGIHFDVVLQVFVLSLGHMFALIIPMAVLPATIMAFGSLSAENEITAMKSCGVSLYRMMAPGLFIASLLAILMIFYNNHLLPESNHKLRNLLVDIYKKKPSIRIKPNTFIDEFEGYTIYVRHKDDKTGRIRDVQIFEHSKKGSLPRTIVAERGMLTYLEKEHLLRFELENGEIHEMPEAADASTYRKTTFRTYVMTIEDVDRTLKRTERRYRGDREMSTKQMTEKISEIKGDIGLVLTKMNQVAHHQVDETLSLLDPEYRRKHLQGEAAETRAKDGGRAAEIPPVEGSKENRPVPYRSERPFDHGRKEQTTLRALLNQMDIKESYLRQINRYEVEIHKKFSIPFACIVFVLLGAPIAIRTGRSGMNTAIGLSILFFLLYYVFLIGGEKLADRRLITPFLAMWGANIVCGTAGVLLVRSTVREQSIIRWYRLNPLRWIVRR